MKTSWRFWITTNPELKVPAGNLGPFTSQRAAVRMAVGIGRAVTLLGLPVTVKVLKRRTYWDADRSELVTTLVSRAGRCEMHPTVPF